MMHFQKNPEKKQAFQKTCGDFMNQVYLEFTTELIIRVYM